MKHFKTDVEGLIKHSCVYCSDSGWIMAAKLETGEIYAFRCGVCRTAINKGLSESIPLWTSREKIKFENWDKYTERAGWKELREKWKSEKSSVH